MCKSKFTDKMLISLKCTLIQECINSDYVYFDFFGENRPEFDKVRYQGKDYFIFGRRKSGYFDIRDLNGEKINKGSISYKKLSLVETRRSYLTERRLA